MPESLRHKIQSYHNKIIPVTTIEVTENLNMLLADVPGAHNEHMTSRLIPGQCFYGIREGQLFILVVWAQEAIFAL